MSQNRSTAVMQRRKVAPDSLDYFPTPPFATRALCEALAAELGDLSGLTAWEPAAGEGHMARPLLEHFGAVRISDVHPYALVGGLGAPEIIDFAVTGATEPPVDLVITNPPFKMAQAFIETALKVSRLGVAMLVRTAFLEGQDRHRDLFSTLRPTYVLQFVERVAMLEGRLVRAGDIDPFAEKAGTKVSSATAYCWIVYLKGQGGQILLSETADTRTRWIAPCRHRLERPGDYPDYAIDVLPPPEDGLFGAAPFPANSAAAGGQA